MVELERRARRDGWHAARLRFYPDQTWRRTSEGVLAHYLLLRTAMIVQSPSSGSIVVDQDMNQLKLLDFQGGLPVDYKPDGRLPRVTTVSSFDSEDDAVHAAEHG